jgi:hypothetical protein
VKKSMVIVVEEDGQVQSMHREDVMTLEFLGRQEITRATDIRFDSATQKWGIWPCFSGEFLPPTPSLSGFFSYEKARSFEVLWAEQCLRLGTEIGAAESYEVAEAMRAWFDSQE